MIRKMTNKRSVESRLSHGSALILTVVLTTLLAIVGVLFVMVSRVDKIATSAISENKELNFAVESVIAKITEELVLDVPGVAGQEYHDYPGPQDKWLACLEPFDIDPDPLVIDPCWLQISDIYNKLDAYQGLRPGIVPDYQDARIMAEGLLADADGDGVADSRWVIMPGMSSNKGKPIYSAIRIVDNGGMLNVNTAFEFNPGGNREMVDGSSQLQVNLMALAGRPGNPPTQAEETDLLQARANYGADVDYRDLNKYEENVVWCYGEPNGTYTPFDISDELELRYRFVLNNTAIDTRLENWGGEFRNDTLWTPIKPSNHPDPQQRENEDKQNVMNWFKRAFDDGSIDQKYAYRHIATTYNMDRIIDPNGRKMVNVNTAEISQIHQALRTGIDSADREQIAAQLAVNIIDFRDGDVEVTTLPVGPRTYYGFEAQPFISEIAFKISQSNPDASTNNYFAIELYNPFNVDIPLSSFSLELRRGDVAVSTINLAGHAMAANSRFVITNSSAASSEFGVTALMSMGGGKEDSNLQLAKYVQVSTDPPSYTLSERYDIYLLRKVASADIYLDQQKTEDAWFAWDSAKGKSQFYCRADSNWNVIYQSLEPSGNTMGTANGVIATKKNYNFENFMGRFITAGDIVRVLIVGPSTEPSDMIGVRLAAEPPEELVRLDLTNPAFSNILQYLTVIDPEIYGWEQNETRIKGRINVNTAPWFVMAQLPWMQPAIAQAIVAYRDASAGGFTSISELVQVAGMDFYASDPADLTAFPDLTPGDGAGQDFEERDIIFSRISNMVIVRSDVFTAYILVRIGIDGPQKRVIAILDRSNVFSSDGKVRVVALHPVPDPR